MKKIIYVDMDDVLCDFTTAHNDALRKTPEIFWPQSQVDFFRKLKPLPGAIDGFMTLFGCDSYDTYILTSPSIYNPMCYMEKRLWVEDHLGFDVLPKLIMANDKSLLRGDYLIDDRAFGNGQDTFNGKLIRFGTRGIGKHEFPNWESVIDFFMNEVDKS